MVKSVFFDGLGLVEGHFSGVGQYILGIMRGLDEILDEEQRRGRVAPDVRIILPRDTVERFRSYGFRHLRPKVLPMSFQRMATLWHSGKMPPLDLFCGPGYYVFTRFVTMPLAYSDSAVIIYDLSYELYREYSDEGNARFLSEGTWRSIRQVDQIFTISEHAKQSIVDFYDVPEGRIRVATPAADRRYFYRRSPHEIAHVKEKYGIEKDYILALSNLEPRKNLDTLIDAYCALPEQYRRDLSLLLVGVNGWNTDELFTKIVGLVDEGYDIIRPESYVSDHDKPAIISGATMLVYPSHFEGFGMPPLEAMACGVPVITADNSSLPEVVGDAAIMVDSHDAQGLVEAIHRSLDDAEAIAEQSLISGPKRADCFSWEASARVYWDVISEKVR